MSILRKCIVVCLLISLSSYSQTNSGDLEVYLNTIISALPGSSGNDYDPPTDSELDAWETVINSINSGDISSGRILASTLNYQIVEYTDTTLSPQGVFYILEEKSPQQFYRGTYVFNSLPCRESLIIEVPHQKYDFNTGKQAVYCFKRLSAKALFLSGTHRCNHSSTSSCSGTTGACGGSGASFRVSDMAHNEATYFHRATEVLFDLINNSVFLQLHGFGKQESDPYVIMSNGTRDTPVIDYVSLLKDELYAVDNSLTFKIAHIDTGWTRLIGFTNTQGRFVNGSTTPCSSSISTTSGRFIHVEQEKSKLRQNATVWNKMYLALSEVFDCSVLSVIDNEIDSKLKIFPNPSDNMLNINGQNMEKLELYGLRGSLVCTDILNKNSSVQLSTKKYVNGMYLLKITTSKNVVIKKIMISHN